MDSKPSTPGPYHFGSSAPPPSQKPFINKPGPPLYNQKPSFPFQPTVRKDGGLISGGGVPKQEMPGMPFPVTASLGLQAKPTFTSPSTSEMRTPSVSHSMEETTQLLTGLPKVPISGPIMTAQPQVSPIPTAQTATPPGQIQPPPYSVPFGGKVPFFMPKTGPSMSVSSATERPVVQDTDTDSLKIPTQTTGGETAPAVLMKTGQPPYMFELKGKQSPPNLLRSGKNLDSVRVDQQVIPEVTTAPEFPSKFPETPKNTTLADPAPSFPNEKSPSPSPVAYKVQSPQMSTQKDAALSPPQPVFSPAPNKETGPAINPAPAPTLPWKPAQGAPAKHGPIYFKLPPPPLKVGVPAAVFPNPAISAPMKPSHPPVPVAPVSPIAAPVFTPPSPNPVFIPKAGPNVPPMKPMFTPSTGKLSFSGTESQPVVVSPVQSGAAKPAFSPFPPAVFNAKPSFPTGPGGKMSFQAAAAPSTQGEKPSFQPFMMKQSQPVAPAPQQGGFMAPTGQANVYPAWDTPAGTANTGFSPATESQPSQDQKAGPFSRKSGAWTPFSSDQAFKPANQPTGLPSASPMNPKPSTAAGSDFKANIPASAQGFAGPPKWVGQSFAMQPKGPQPSEAYRPDPAVASGPGVAGQFGAVPPPYATPSDSGKQTPPPFQPKPSTQVLPAKPGPPAFMKKPGAGLFGTQQMTKCQICQLDREKDLIYSDTPCLDNCAVCKKCMAMVVAQGKKQCPKCGRGLSDDEVGMITVYGHSMS